MAYSPGQLSGSVPWAESTQHDQRNEGLLSNLVPSGKEEAPEEEEQKEKAGMLGSGPDKEAAASQESNLEGATAPLDSDTESTKPPLDVTRGYGAAKAMGQTYMKEGETPIDAGGGYTFIDRGEQGYLVVDAPKSAYESGRKPIGGYIRPGTGMYNQVQNVLGRMAPEAVGETGAAPQVGVEETFGESLPEDYSETGERQEPPAVASFSNIQANELAHIDPTRAAEVEAKSDDERYADYQSAVTGRDEFLAMSLQDFEARSAARAEQAELGGKRVNSQFRSSTHLPRYAAAVQEIVMGREASMTPTPEEGWTMQDPRAQEAIRKTVATLKQRVLASPSDRRRIDPMGFYRSMALSGWPHHIPAEEYWAKTEARISALYGFDVSTPDATRTDFGVGSALPPGVTFGEK